MAGAPLPTISVNSKNLPCLVLPMIAQPSVVCSGTVEAVDTREVDPARFVDRSLVEDGSFVLDVFLDVATLVEAVGGGVECCCDSVLCSNTPLWISTPMRAVAAVMTPPIAVKVPGRVCHQDCVFCCSAIAEPPDFPYRPLLGILFSVFGRSFRTQLESMRSSRHAGGGATSSHKEIGWELRRRNRRGCSV